MFRRAISSATKLHKQTLGNQIVQVRNHGGTANYRCASRPSKEIKLLGELTGALMWYWCLYHIWTEPDHILGEFPYPDPSKWTDEELGIPAE
ncbi:NADH dehydrogenase [ubiquinone] 1 beta subcomplex subunit 2, mitochondrial-like [Ctenocephalides felis]|uniref:NADH dehydrogenase [ubiquinone] 1 beta subcomplex subunit 2, mitochondrial-like n=1 Tax=Ctenocephalides felis TaxID=7515 RepID=UPI000E6E3D68|nr:NADH dehydrogenase [ubiquinone] 1 beta subcomplex subunit 2, mitochondrial-like [Ctenocephalides felis]